MAADRNILPIQSILNRTPPTTRRPRTPRSPPRSASDRSSPASDLHEATAAELTPTADGRLVQRAGAKKARDSSDLSYTVPQGPIKYPPYEDLEPDQLELVSVFDVKPFGQISQWCAHISYSSDKKDVFEKTGRESFHGECLPVPDVAWSRGVTINAECVQFSCISSRIPVTDSLTMSCGIIWAASSASVPSSSAGSTRR